MVKTDNQTIKKAMIMAAGVGSRLGILSEILPKPLVPIANIPAMDILLKHLSSFGIKDVIANTFYKAEDIQNRYKDNNLGINFNFIKEQSLSGTAGGLKKCQFFFEDVDDFIVLSGDGLTDIDINEAYKSHKAAGTIATIVTKEVDKQEVSKYGIIVTDKNGIIKFFQEKPSIDEAMSNLANTGIYIFKREIFDFIPADTFYDFAKNVFASMMKAEIKINTYNHKGYWSDIGSISQYIQSNFDILNNKIPALYSNNGSYIKGANTIIKTSSEAVGNTVIGNNCYVGEKSVIKNSILWDNVKVKDNVIIENSIILSDTEVENSCKNVILKGKYAVQI